MKDVEGRIAEAEERILAHRDAEYIRLGIALPVRISYEERVIEKIKDRKRKGMLKYGVGMERTDLSEKDWLTHAQEEAMDLAIYLERCLDKYK